LWKPPDNPRKEVEIHIMIEQSNGQVAEAPIGWAFGPVLDRAKRVWATIADILTVNAKVRGAAVLYEDLSRLSDAELERRGIPRADLPRYIFETLDRE
jgi:hypothetical protein